TGVTNVGVFVQLRKYLVDGLIRLDDMPDDWWDINPQGGYMIGQRTRRRVGIGNPVSVQIAAVDLAARELELVFIAEGEGGRAAGPREGRGRGRKRGAARALPERLPEEERGRERGEWRAHTAGGGEGQTPPRRFRRGYGRQASPRSRMRGGKGGRRGRGR